MRTSSAALVAALFALAATSAGAAQKTRTKPNNSNELHVASETVQLLWGSDAPSDVHILGGTITPATGTEWSFGASNSSSASTSGMSSGKASYSDLSVMKRSKGPGTLSISFKGDSSGACPVTYDAIKPITGVGIVVKKNPGGSSERFTLSDVSVSRCDASGMAISYSSIATYDLKKNDKI